VVDDARPQYRPVIHQGRGNQLVAL
jgi:hypothetical protein